MRVGSVAKKIGMSFIYSATGERIPVTLLKIADCEVVEVKNVEKHGYTALQVAAGDVKEKNVTKPMKGHYNKHNVKPKMHIKEFRVNSDCLLESGTKIKCDHYVVGQYVDLQATSIGKGFAGVMKRHGFAGLRASHGVSIAHRSQGSTGQCQDPGRVPKGKKMAGQMGNKVVTVQNLRVVAIDLENDMIAVKGAVPGSQNNFVYISDAIKKALPSSAPYPAVKKESSTACSMKEIDGVSNES
jgi:large subunit ribosomal protein L3